MSVINVHRFIDTVIYNNFKPVLVYQMLISCLFDYE